MSALGRYYSNLDCNISIKTLIRQKFCLVSLAVGQELIKKLMEMSIL